MRTPTSVYSHFFSTLSDWYPNPYDTSVDDLLFLQQVKAEPDYQRFQQWNSALELALKNNREELRKTIAKNPKDPLQAYRKHLLAYQDNTQKNILSPFYYDKQLTKSEKKLKQEIALGDENPFSEAKKQLKKKLKAQPEQAELYFYHDVMNGLIDYYLMDRTKQENADEMLRDLLNYYKDLVEHRLLDDIRIEVEALIKNSESYYQQEENTFDRLPSKIMKRVFTEVETIFEDVNETHAEKNDEKEGEESFTTRFYNKVQETKSAFQSNLRNTTDRARKIVAIGAAAISLAQPGFAQSTQTTKTDASNSTDKQEDDDTILLSKRQGGVPIVSTPFYMNEIGNHPVNSSAFTIQLVNDKLFMANYENGLLIFNVSDPWNPSILGQRDTNSLALDLFILNNRAYLACYSAGLVIIDITDPGNLNVIGSYITPDLAYGVSVLNNSTYIADYYSGFQILNTSIPGAITPQGGYNTPGRALDVVLSSDGNTAFMADGEGGLLILDTSVQQSPTYVGNYDTPDVARNVILLEDDNVTCLADQNGGIYFLRVNNRNNPTLLSSYSASSTALAIDIAVSNNETYIAYDNLGIYVLDTSSFTSPTLVGSYNATFTRARSVVVSDHFVYASDEPYGLRILIKDFVPTLLTNRLTLQQGQTRILDSSNLNASDRDDEDSTLTYVIEETALGSLHGSFRDRNNGGAIVTEFTKQQVDSGDIEFRHDGGISEPDYTVRVEDGVASAPPNQTTISFSLLPTPTPTPISSPTPAASTSMGTTFTPTTTANAGTSTLTTNAPTTGTAITQNIDSNTSIESSNLLWLWLLVGGVASLAIVIVIAIFAFKLLRKNQSDQDSSAEGYTDIQVLPVQDVEAQQPEENNPDENYQNVTTVTVVTNGNNTSNKQIINEQQPSDTSSQPSDYHELSIFNRINSQTENQNYQNLNDTNDALLAETDDTYNNVEVVMKKH